MGSQLYLAASFCSHHLPDELRNGASERKLNITMNRTKRNDSSRFEKEIRQEYGATRTFMSILIGIGVIECLRVNILDGDLIAGAQATKKFR